MPLLTAEMGHVQRCRRIVCTQPENIAGIQRDQALAGLKHGKRTKQPPGIKFYNRPVDGRA